MLRLAACAVLMCYATASTGQMPPAAAKIAPLPEIKVGDWWLPKNRPGTVVVTAISDGRITMTRGDGKQAVYTSELNTLEYPSSSGETVTEKPFNPNLSFPLWPGKEWSGEVKVFVGTTQTGSYSRRAKAGPWERVALDSRELEAIRIDYESTNNPPMLTCWYAPEAKAIVKCQAPGVSSPGYLLSDFGVDGK